MVGFGILGMLWISFAAHADTPALRRVFDAYREMRQLEERARLTRARSDLEEGERLELSASVEHSLEEARQKFTQLQAAPGLTEEERRLTKGKARPTPADLEFLRQNYAPLAKAWSPLEWQCAREWFGKDAEDELLRSAFAMEKISPSPTTRKTEKRRVVWITDPLARYLTREESERKRAEREAVKSDLAKQGYQVEEMEVAAFARTDDQAEELHLSITQRIEGGGPFTLVSAGHASAVLLRALDLNPALLRNPAVLGWVNVNGQLFGAAPLPSRGPASVTSPKADRQLLDAQHELLLLRQERLSPQTPLGAKFPVLNLVTTKGAYRPGPDLRDSLLPDAKTYFVEDGKGSSSALRDALPLLDLTAKP